MRSLCGCSAFTLQLLGLAVTQSAGHAIRVAGVVVVGRARRVDVAEIVAVAGVRGTGIST